MKKPRLIATVAVVAAALLFVIYVPLPYHVDCSFIVEPRGAKAVYAAVPGRLAEVTVKAGESVQEKVVLARLDNVDLQLQIANLEGRLVKLQHELETLELQRRLDKRYSAQIKQYTVTIEATKQQIADKKKQQELLIIRSPATGKIIPAPRRPAPPTPDGKLPAWSGTALDQKNLNAQLMQSDMICRVGDPNNLEVILVIDQADIDFVKKGQEVDVLLDAYSGKSLQTKIDDIADEPLKVAPPSLASQAGGQLDTYTDRSGALRPLHTSYPARAPLKDYSHRVQIGMRGRAKIYTDWRPLGDRLYRFIARTFHFEL